MTVAELAATNYLHRWRVLRAEALKLSKEAAGAPPLARRVLRNQAALVDQYAIIAHHAAWREANLDAPEIERRHD